MKTLAPLVLTALMLFSPSAHAEPEWVVVENPEPVLVNFGPGERMVFSIDYGLVNAGEGILEIVGIEEYQGHPCYHIQSKTSCSTCHR